MKWISIAGLVVLVGCSGSNGGGAAEGQPCGATTACATGLVCAAGRCVSGAGMPCSSTSDCTAPLVCAAGTCSVADAGPGGGSDAPTGCGEFPFVVTPGGPADLVLVVDRSLSMDDDLPGGGGTKWEALLGAVDSVTHALEATADFGLAIYPLESTCGPGAVVLDPATNNADSIMSTLRGGGPDGATPTAPTLASVGSYLAIPRAGHEGHSPAILLATDGAPNCNESLDGSSCTCTVSGSTGGADCGGGRFCLDDAGTYAAIEASVAAMVPVYVIGLPGSEAFADVLSEMARRGGTARAADPAYYAATDGAELESALTEIAEGFVSCVFEMSVAPENPRQVQILLDGTAVPHTDDRTDGWAYTDPSNTVFELFGAPCDRLKDGATHNVTASYACIELF